MKIFKNLTIVVALLSALATMGSANETPKSQAAIETWKQRVASKLRGETSFRYNAIGVAVEKVNGDTVRVNLTPAVSTDVRVINALSITVQPVEVMSSGNGTILRVVGNAGKIASGMFERDTSDSEYLGDRQITLAMGEGVNALKISVFGLGSDVTKPYTIILPIEKEGKSAALGQVTSTSASETLSNRCQWFVGYCQGTCEVQCVGCSDGSPVLNCVNCSMGCANGQTCTPSGPVPVDCNP